MLRNDKERSQAWLAWENCRHFAMPSMTSWWNDLPNSIEFLHLFVRRHFAVKPTALLQNVGCSVRLTTKQCVVCQGIPSGNQIFCCCMDVMWQGNLTPPFDSFHRSCCKKCSFRKGMTLRQWWSHSCMCASHNWTKVTTVQWKLS